MEHDSSLNALWQAAAMGPGVGFGNGCSLLAGLALQQRIRNFTPHANVKRERVHAAAISPTEFSMPAMPRDDHLDSSALLLADPYRYISRRCRELGSDLFEARLMLAPAICMTGAAAARLFYDAERFRREGAAPEPLRATLFGKSTLQGLDGDTHRLRKKLFMEMTCPPRMQELVHQATLEWQRLALRWQREPAPVVLYHAACEVLTRAVCSWAGVPLPEADVDERSHQLRAMFEQTANSLSGHLGARLARSRAEDWLQGLIERQRIGENRLQPGRAARHIALDMRQANGERLAARDAAQELLNLLRPTVAVAVYITFGAHALHAHPQYRDWLQHDDERAQAFVDEVRRCYPFFPALVARTRLNFEWNGYLFPEGRRVILDLYGTHHDPRSWPAPDAFRPQRFLESRPDPYSFIPQGGGDTVSGHRCPGEGISVALTAASLAFLCHDVGYHLPPQDLELDMANLPALPRDRIIIEPRQHHTGHA